MKKISDQLSIPLSIFVLISAMAGAYITFILFKNRFVELEHKNLNSIVQNKSDNIGEYLEYIIDTKYLWYDLIDTKYFESDNIKEKRLIAERFVSGLDIHNDFNKLFLVNKETEEVLFSVDFKSNNNINTNRIFQEETGFTYKYLFRNGNISEIVNNSDLKDNIYINFKSIDNKYNKYGLVAELNKNKIDSILLSSYGITTTGETYIVDSNKIMRSPSIFIKRSQIRVDTKIINNCLNKNFAEESSYQDYRGIDVFGHWGVLKIGNYDYCMISEIDLQELYQPLYDAIKIIVASFIVLVLTIVLFISITLRRMLSPLGRLTEVAESIRLGNLQKDIPIINSNNELETLSKAIKRMIDRLRQEDFKHQLISKVSHELRTPMTIARGYLELVTNNKKDKLSSESRSYLEKTDTQIKYLINFINDILDLNKIQSGKIEFKKNIIKVYELIKDIEEYSNILFIKKNIKLIIGNIDKNMNIMADYDNVRRALVNILSNSYKYTADNGQVNIDVRKSKDKMLIIITDNGKGISKEKLKTVFNEYVTKDGGEVDLQSTGLGLPITRELLYKMDGDIKIESEENVGTIVTITLPTK